MNRLAKIGVTLLAFVMILAAMPPSATAQIQIFSTGGYGVPETISLAPSGFGTFGGSYFIPDARLANIWIVPGNGGPPTAFLPAPLPTPNCTIGGMFFPSGWGETSGKFLDVCGGSLKVFDSSGNMTVLDHVGSPLTLPLIAPDAFAPYGGQLFISDQAGFVWRVDPAGGGLTLFKDLNASPFLVDPFGLEFTPPGFGTFGNRLMVSDASSGDIAALAPDGTGSIFATLPLAPGQDGLRQMLITPDDYFLDSLDISGRLLLVSVSGSPNGGGTFGALRAVDSSGAVVAHLRTGGVLAKFDPRGMVFTADGHILISDTSDPIYIASASRFHRRSRRRNCNGAVSRPSLDRPEEQRRSGHTVRPEGPSCSRTARRWPRR